MGHCGTIFTMGQSLQDANSVDLTYLEFRFDHVQGSIVSTQCRNTNAVPIQSQIHQEKLPLKAESIIPYYSLLFLIGDLYRGVPCLVLAHNRARQPRDSKSTPWLVFCDLLRLHKAANWEEESNELFAKGLTKAVASRFLS